VRARFIHAHGRPSRPTQSRARTPQIKSPEQLFLAETVDFLGQQGRDFPEVAQATGSAAPPAATIAMPAAPPAARERGSPAFLASLMSVYPPHVEAADRSASVEGLAYPRDIVVARAPRGRRQEANEKVRMEDHERWEESQRVVEPAHRQRMEGESGPLEECQGKMSVCRAARHIERGERMRGREREREREKQKKKRGRRRRDAHDVKEFNVSDIIREGAPQVEIPGGDALIVWGGDDDTRKLLWRRRRGASAMMISMLGHQPLAERDSQATMRPPPSQPSGMLPRMPPPPAFCRVNVERLQVLP
jgi:hypothetical protein